MIIAPHHTETAPDQPLELLRTMLEEQFVLQTRRLTELTIYGRLPGHAGYDPNTLDILTTSARQAIADTAQALRRMTEGTYGRCEQCQRPIPLGRLREVPHARYCTRCHRHRGS
ncbi:TraR/DksA family transcriptional regulator [Paractinoplanes rishiriensis]|uniref:Zinc finger DksA/TraR C4-type domain-containing protein n=1 Tax=Paractinoplanes rishiriensis TaxID=1050105 RepID=A0A919KCJ5_9ACTN|nr:TraR/DksA C4-type zinc finger protein [Actinoplanes rishiriensis]GIF01142.1 hypothetical protein Ari01nite_86060 [Actinoplanes rishiriensis]